MSLQLKIFESLPATTYLDLLRDGDLKVTCSQLGEDTILIHLLVTHVQKVHNGFYVDVGAYHPRELSNTRLLHFLGWRGVNIDANPKAIAAFEAERPNDINVCTGIGTEEQDLTYYHFAGGAASTFSPEMAEHLRSSPSFQQVGQETLHVRPLNDVLTESVPPGTVIDYMDIDIEGLDRKVVEHLDFDRFGPSVLSIELHEADLMRLGEDPTVRYIVGKGYKLMAVNIVTFTFMRQSLFKP